METIELSYSNLYCWQIHHSVVLGVPYGYGLMVEARAHEKCDKVTSVIRMVSTCGVFDNEPLV